MTSPLQKFTQAAAAKAFTVIGAESITISGGHSISGILNEASVQEEYEEGGYEQSGAFTFVVLANVFSASYPGNPNLYLKAIAVARGKNWRISRISGGKDDQGQFVSLELVTPNKSS